MGIRLRKHRECSSGGLLALVLAAAVSLAAPGSAAAIPGFPPVASIDASPNPAEVDQVVHFDASASTGDAPGPLGGTITGYDWDLDGDGSFETHTAAGTPTTSRSYASPGTVVVKLKVTDSEGDSDEDSVTLRVNTPPVAGFVFEPATPAVGETITFTSTSFDPDGALADGSIRWDFDNDGQRDDASGRSVTFAFGSPGNKPVNLEVTDADGEVTVVSRGVLVQASPPSAGFTFSPDEPLSHETVTFDGSSSAAPAGETITSMTWDLDGDGQFNDATGPTAEFAYATPSPRHVGLRVEASGGSFDVASGIVPVGNRDPVASFVVSPGSPSAGARVELTSTSADPDGPLADQAWDLDGDGDYDDASGASASTAFDRPGSFTVGLRVRDAHGATNEVRTPISVSEPILELMSPFPVVRLSGELRASGKTQIKRLSVRAPQGTNVTVRCQGRSCPFHERSRIAPASRVAFPALGQNPLRPGVLIKLFITDPAKIGKFTRFKIRKARAPKRVDHCLAGEGTVPVSCAGE